MAYFNEDFLKFLENLSRNNNREWFNSHKSEFATNVREPFLEFVGELIHRVGDIDPNVAMEPRNAMFRIHRDVRFSKDKKPYKTHMAAALTRGDKKDFQYPGLYVHLGHDKAVVAGGLHAPDKDSVRAMRDAIYEDPTRFRRIVTGKKFTAAFGELRGERLKRVPKEFADRLDKAPWLANKQFYYWTELPPNTALQDDLVDMIVARYKTAGRLHEFMREALGIT